MHCNNSLKALEIKAKSDESKGWETKKLPRKRNSNDKST